MGRLRTSLGRLRAVGDASRFSRTFATIAAPPSTDVIDAVYACVYGAAGWLLVVVGGLFCLAHAPISRKKPADTGTQEWQACPGGGGLLLAAAKC